MHRYEPPSGHWIKGTTSKVVQDMGPGSQPGVRMDVVNRAAVFDFDNAVCKAMEITYQTTPPQVEKHHGQQSIQILFSQFV
jgi:hypothetical protein